MAGQITSRISEIIGSTTRATQPSAPIVESAARPVALFDINGKVREINQALSNITSQLLPLSAGDVDFLPIATANIAANAVTAIVSGTSASSIAPGLTETDLMTQAITSTGGTLLIIAITTVMNNNTSGAVGDITLTHKLTDNSNTMLDTRSFRSAVNAGQIVSNTSVAFAIATPSSGSVTYKSRGISTSSSLTSTFTEHMMIILELKK